MHFGVERGQQSLSLTPRQSVLWRWELSHSVPHGAKDLHSGDSSSGHVGGG